MHMCTCFFLMRETSMNLITFLDNINLITIVLLISLLFFIVFYYIYQKIKIKIKIFIGGNEIKLFLVYITWMVILLFGDLYISYESLFLHDIQLIIIFTMLLLIVILTVMFLLFCVSKILKRADLSNKVINIYFTLTGLILLLICIATI